MAKFGVGGEVIIDSQAVNAGIIYVKDIQHSSGKLLSYMEIVDKHGSIIPWLTYNAITAALSKVQTKKEENEFTNQKIYEKMLTQSKKVAIIYKMIMEQQENGLEHALVKMNKRFHVTMIELEKAFKAINVITSITKYRDFQY